MQSRRNTRFAAALTLVAILTVVVAEFAAPQVPAQSKASAGNSLATVRAGLEASPFLVVLGIAQDAGIPQAGCQRTCCQQAWQDASARRHPASLAVIDPAADERWLFDCTPAFPDQLRLLDGAASEWRDAIARSSRTRNSKRTDPPIPLEHDVSRPTPNLAGVFLTHAHVGHYAGLVHFGREAMGTRAVPVYAMPRLRQFLTNNGPWSQLVDLENVGLVSIEAGRETRLNARIGVTPILVPHRDEFSETVGFRIRGPACSVLYLPDIDKWERAESRIEELVSQVDVAYIDGTFFADGELPGRRMAEVPHPFIVETIERFRTLAESERSKLRFIHLNHTNPARDAQSDAAAMIRRAGHRVAVQGERFPL